MKSENLINEVFDDVEETHCSLQQLTDEELIECRKVLEKRLEKVLFKMQEREKLCR